MRILERNDGGGIDVANTRLGLPADDSTSVGRSRDPRFSAPLARFGGIPAPSASLGLRLTAVSGVALVLLNLEELPPAVFDVTVGRNRWNGPLGFFPSPSSVPRPGSDRLRDSLSTIRAPFSLALRTGPRFNKLSLVISVHSRLAKISGGTFGFSSEDDPENSRTTASPSLARFVQKPVSFSKYSFGKNTLGKPEEEAGVSPSEDAENTRTGGRSLFCRGEEILRMRLVLRFGVLPRGR